MTAPAVERAGDEAGARAALLVVAAGVAAALHVGKLPPAMGALREALGLTLFEAGVLLSLVQLAGVVLGVVFGSVADGLGLKRSMVLGLAILGASSAAGGFANGPAMLMALRTVEGFGFLLVVAAAPALLRRLVPPARLARVLGVWGAYMSTATALALLAGPPWIAAWGWPSWWWLLGAISALAALAVARAVPDRRAPAAAHGAALSIAARLRLTLASFGPWGVAVTFAAYTSQWLAVIGFLPTLAAQAGLSAGLIGVLGALAAAVNIAGNVGAGRLLHRGIAAPRLLVLAFAVMTAMAIVAFAETPAGSAPAWARYAAVLVFSMVGGMIPATLFSLAVRVAPGEAAVATTVGWLQQWSSLGQLVGPPLVAAVASAAGGWHWTWAVTGAGSLAGLVLVARLTRWMAARSPR